MFRVLILIGGYDNAGLLCVGERRTGEGALKGIAGVVHTRGSGRAFGQLGLKVLEPE